MKVQVYWSLLTLTGTEANDSCIKMPSSETSGPFVLERIGMWNGAIGISRCQWDLKFIDIPWCRWAGLKLKQLLSKIGSSAPDLQALRWRFYAQIFNFSSGLYQRQRPLEGKKNSFFVSKHGKHNRLQENPWFFLYLAWFKPFEVPSIYDHILPW